MRYQCNICSGPVELEGEYGGELLQCPHCQASAQFTIIAESPPVIPVTAEVLPPQGNVPPVLEALTPIQMAGDDQPIDGVIAGLQQVAGYCTRDETVLRLVIQSKLASVSLTPDLVAATNRRVIVLQRGLFGCKMWDALWIDVADVRIEERLRGAVITIALVQGVSTAVENLPKNSARGFYRLCQSLEEAMRAERRAQSLHAAAVAAGKINVNINR